jgi:hypothetical protein
VVNKHHGDLRVESVPGDTRFQIRLPIEPETVPDESALIAPVQAEPIQPENS